jgi:TRAP-type transport system periplasmic protein
MFDEGNTMTKMTRRDVLKTGTAGALAPDVQQVMQKHMNAAAKRQRDDIVRANADLQKSLEGKGLTFNKVDPAPFRAALKSSGFYKQAQQQFGPEAWALLTKYTRPIG